MKHHVFFFVLHEEIIMIQWKELNQCKKKGCIE